MPSRRVETGPTGATVRERIRAIRDGRGLSLADVCRRLSDLGCRIRVTALSDIENGARRVDVDDLVFIAAALDVSPITLLMPSAKNAAERVTVTAFESPTAGGFWRWLRAKSLPNEGATTVKQMLRFGLDSQPEWFDEDQERKNEERN